MIGYYVCVCVGLGRAKNSKEKERDIEKGAQRAMGREGVKKTVAEDRKYVCWLFVYEIDSSYHNQFVCILPYIHII